MKVALVIMLLAVSVQACSNKVPDLKSPCVGAEESPCGPKRPANDWLYS